MKNIIIEYWSSIIVVLVMLCVLAYLYKLGKRELVKKIILSIVIQAEKALGSGTGPLKYAMVVEGVYKILPSILKILITKKELDNMIEDAVQYMKEYLSSDKNLLGYEYEKAMNQNNSF